MLTILGVDTLSTEELLECGLLKMFETFHASSRFSFQFVPFFLLFEDFQQYYVGCNIFMCCLRLVVFSPTIVLPHGVSVSGS